MEDRTCAVQTWFSTVCKATC